ncbi:unnamed protein product [Gordionus sp. m RMFG-2023]
MSENKKNLLEDFKIKGGDFLRETLTNCTDPIKAIQDFQRENGIHLASLQSALPFLDLHNIPRLEFHESILHELKNLMINRIKELTKTLERSSIPVLSPTKLPKKPVDSSLEFLKTIALSKSLEFKNKNLNTHDNNETRQIKKKLTFIGGKMKLITVKSKKIQKGITNEKIEEPINENKSIITSDLNSPHKKRILNTYVKSSMLSISKPPSSPNKTKPTNREITKSKLKPNSKLKIESLVKSETSEKESCFDETKLKLLTDLLEKCFPAMKIPQMRQIPITLMEVIPSVPKKFLSQLLIPEIHHITSSPNTILQQPYNQSQVTKIKLKISKSKTKGYRSESAAKLKAEIVSDLLTSPNNNLTTPSPELDKGESVKLSPTCLYHLCSLPVKRHVWLTYPNIFNSELSPLLRNYAEARTKLIAPFPDSSALNTPNTNLSSFHSQNKSISVMHQYYLALTNKERRSTIPYNNYFQPISMLLLGPPSTLPTSLPSLFTLFVKTCLKTPDTHLDQTSNDHHENASINREHHLSTLCREMFAALRENKITDGGWFETLAKFLWIFEACERDRLTSCSSSLSKNFAVTGSAFSGKNNVPPHQYHKLYYYVKSVSVETFLKGEYGGEMIKKEFGNDESAGKKAATPNNLHHHNKSKLNIPESALISHSFKKHIAADNNDKDPFSYHENFIGKCQELWSIFTTSLGSTAVNTKSRVINPDSPRGIADDTATKLFISDTSKDKTKSKGRPVGKKVKVVIACPILKEPTTNSKAKPDKSKTGTDNKRLLNGEASSLATPNSKHKRLKTQPDSISATPAVKKDAKKMKTEKDLGVVTDVRPIITFPMDVIQIIVFMLQDPFTVDFLCSTILKTLSQILERNSLPRNEPVLTICLHFLSIALTPVQNLLKSDQPHYALYDADNNHDLDHLTTTFLPALVEVMADDDVSTLEEEYVSLTGKGTCDETSNTKKLGNASGILRRFVLKYENPLAQKLCCYYVIQYFSTLTYNLSILDDAKDLVPPKTHNPKGESKNFINSKCSALNILSLLAKCGTVMADDLMFAHTLVVILTELFNAILARHMLMVGRRDSITNTTTDDPNSKVR